MSFKKAEQIKPIKFKEYEYKYQWVENSKDDNAQDGVNFELVKVNIQDEINEYAGCDLKTMIEKNIMPTRDEKPVYADTTHLNNLDLASLYNAADTEIVGEPDNDDRQEQSTNNNNADNGTDTNNQGTTQLESEKK